MTKMEQMYSEGPDWPIFPKLAGKIIQSVPTEYIYFTWKTIPLSLFMKWVIIYMRK